MGNQQAHIRPKDVKLAQNMFKVRNVDDKGTEVRRAVIEVTKSDIILHQRGKDPIKWPLRSLRRYGFDKKLFSFESGRRCATGPGIYAFKCKRAEFLFRNVQENAQTCVGGTNRYGSYSASSETSNGTTPTETASPALSPFSAGPSHFTDNGSIASGSTYGLATFTGRTLSTSTTASGAQSPSSPGTSVHYINANSFADIPESPQEDAVDSSSVMASLLPQVSEESRPSSEEEDPNVNYARLKHDIDEDLTQLTVTDAETLTQVQNDVNGNMDSIRVPSSAMTTRTLALANLPEPYYMKPSSVQDIVNGNAAPLKNSGLNLNSNANVISLTDTAVCSPEAGNHDCTTSNASPASVTSPMSTTSLMTPSSRTSGSSSYYANLDTVGELPHNNFVFCCDLRSPCSTSSSKGSAGSEFVFDGSVGGNRSPVSEHSYANLDVLSEVGIRPTVFNGATNVVLQPVPKGRMNYADLDLEKMEAAGCTPIVQPRQSRSSSMTSSPPKTPASLNSSEGSVRRADTLEGSSRRTDTYALIDFNRTTALANSQRQIGDTDLPGGSLRRTRHDSKIR